MIMSNLTLATNMDLVLLVVISSLKSSFNATLNDSDGCFEWYSICIVKAFHWQTLNQPI